MAAVKKKTAKKVAKKKAAKKKAPAKKPAKKAPVKKATAKKKVAKKAATEKAPAKKAATKKRATKKGAGKKASSIVPPKVTPKVKPVIKKGPRKRPVKVPSRPVVPAAKPLTKTQKNAFRVTLDTKQKEIHALYNDDVRKGLKTTNDGAEDVVDRANQAYNRELNFALSDGERDLLLLIEEAQLRLETPQFGICLNCQRQIAELRLEAVPWAKYCIDCQEMQERGLLTE